VSECRSGYQPRTLTRGACPRRDPSLSKVAFVTLKRRTRLAASRSDVRRLFSGFEMPIKGCEVAYHRTTLHPAPRLRLGAKMCEVCEPAVKHTVTLVELQRWVNGATRSPAEKVRRERMRQLLNGGARRNGDHDR
jgi:hypothetical protein